MNLRRMACAAGLALAVVASSQVAASAETSSDATYYLSLGDSLSVGYQPAHQGPSGTVPAGDTDEGYADQLYPQLQKSDSNLVLEKRGCSGENTTSMLNGGKFCDYAGSQVDAAVKFLTDHPGKVKYITIDIGANDVQTCVDKTTGSIKIDCAVAGVATLAQNLPVILGKIKVASVASGNTPTIVGMNYYNPFLVSFLKPGGSQGLFLTAVTSLAQYVVNTIEENEYRAVGARVADVSGAFQSFDFFAPQKGLPGVGPVPVPVFNICTLTYICAVGDIHARPNGYGVIAKAFADALA